MKDTKCDSCGNPAEVTNEKTALCKPCFRAHPTDSRETQATLYVPPELPTPAVTYADHSFPAFSRKQMQAYGQACVDAYKESNRGE